MANKAPLQALLAAVPYPRKTKQLAERPFDDKLWVDTLDDLVPLVLACPDPAQAIDTFCRERFRYPGGKNTTFRTSSEFEDKVKKELGSLVAIEGAQRLMSLLRYTSSADLSSKANSKLKNCATDIHSFLRPTWSSWAMILDGAEVYAPAVYEMFGDEAFVELSLSTLLLEDFKTFAGHLVTFAFNVELPAIDRATGRSPKKDGAQKTTPTKYKLSSNGVKRQKLAETGGEIVSEKLAGLRVWQHNFSMRVKAMVTLNKFEGAAQVLTDMEKAARDAYISYLKPHGVPSPATYPWAAGWESA